MDQVRLAASLNQGNEWVPTRGVFPSSSPIGLHSLSCSSPFEPPKAKKTVEIGKMKSLSNNMFDGILQGSLDCV